MIINIFNYKDKGKKTKTKPYHKQLTVWRKELNENIRISFSFNSLLIYVGFRLVYKFYKYHTILLTQKQRFHFKKKIIKFGTN